MFLTTILTLMAIIVGKHPLPDELMEDSHAKRQELLRKEGVDALGPAASDPRIEYWLSCVSPRPKERFKPLTDEKLSPFLAAASMEFFGQAFADIANPWAMNKPWPTGYSIVPDRISLLLYEWQSPQYRFELYESYTMMLLRVRPLKQTWNPPKGLTAGQVSAVVEDVLQPAFCGNKNAKTAFLLPDQLKPGQVFSNFREFQTPTHLWTTPLEQEGVVLIVTDKDLCLVKAKYWGDFRYRQRVAPGITPAQWLDSNLYEKDGKTLVYQRVNGRSPFAPISPSRK